MRERKKLVRWGCRVGALSLIAALCAAFAAIGCGEEKVATDTGGKEPIVIGACVGMTGIMAPWDKPATEALRLAIQDQNAKGGVAGHKLELVVGDFKSDMALGPQVAMELIDKGAKLMMVCCDYDFGSPAAAACGDQKIVSFSPIAGSAKYAVKAAGDYAFSMGMPAADDGYAAAEFAFNKGWKRAYVLIDQSISYCKDCGRGMKEHFSGLGGTVVGEDTFVAGDASIANQIARMKAKSDSIDVILLSSWQSAGPSTMRQLRAAGLDQPIISGDTMDGDFWMKTTPDLSDFYTTDYGSIYGDDPRAEFNDLLDRIEKATGERPVGSDVVGGYSVGETFIKALEMTNGSTDGDAIVKAIESFTDVPLLTGNVSFSSELHSSQGRTYYICGTQNGTRSFDSTLTLSEHPSLPEYVK